MNPLEILRLIAETDELRGKRLVSSNLEEIARIEDQIVLNENLLGELTGIDPDDYRSDYGEFGVH